MVPKGGLEVPLWPPGHSLYPRLLASGAPPGAPHPRVARLPFLAIPGESLQPHAFAFGRILRPDPRYSLGAQALRLRRRSQTVRVPSSRLKTGAEGGTRTPTGFHPQEPESCASANSATSATCPREAFPVPGMAIKTLKNELVQAIIGTDIFRPGPPKSVKNIRTQENFSQGSFL